MLDLLIVVFATLGFWAYVMSPLLEWLDEIHGIRVIPKRWRNGGS